VTDRKICDGKENVCDGKDILVHNNNYQGRKLCGGMYAVASYCGLTKKKKKNRKEKKQKGKKTCIILIALI